MLCKMRIKISFGRCGRSVLLNLEHMGTRFLMLLGISGLDLQGEL